MKLFVRIIQRALIFLAGMACLWFIVTQIFTRLDDRLPAFVSLIITYIFSAYLLLPELVRITLRVLRRKKIPRVTQAADGLSADPVNIITELKKLGLIPLGTDAWLGRTEQSVEDNREKPTNGSIILVHGNGNNPESIFQVMPYLLDNNIHWLSINNAVIGQKK